MKNCFKWILVLSIGLLIIVTVGACQFVNSHIARQNANKENDSYEDYICRDKQLVCVDKGESMGRNIIKIGEKSYQFEYRRINDVLDKDFIAAKMQLQNFFPYQSDVVLQHPANETDVLTDWTIKEVELYYFDRDEITNLLHGTSTTKDDMKIHSITKFSEKDLIEEVMCALLVPELGQNFMKDEMGINYKSVDVFAEKDEAIEVYLRVHFEESESLVWDSAIGIYRSKNDDTKYAITLTKGTMDEAFEYNVFRIQLDPTSDLYQLILSIYEDGKIGATN